MVKRIICVLVALAIASTANAAFLSEDWETGTDGWTAVGSIVPTVSPDQNTTPGGQYSLRTADTATNYTNAMDATIVMPSVIKSWTATWSFFDTGSTREYIQLRSYSGGGGSGSLQQLITLGTYNAAPCTSGVYNFRVAVGSVNWQNTTIARAANVWHAMKVEQIDLGDGNATLNFYIDGVLGATANTTAVFSLTQVRVGSGLGNNNHGAYYDDIVLTPEPVTMVLLALGGLMFSRRRA